MQSSSGLSVSACLGSVALAVFLLVSGCATNPVTGKQNFVLMSEQQEIQLGKESHQKIVTEYPLYDDPDLQSYVDTLGKRIAAGSHRNNLNFSFHVLDSPQVNAFALPGGYVYVTRGIMVYMDNEAQLAGVLGHEIGHITARHGVRQQSRGLLVGLLGSVAAAAVGSSVVNDLSDLLGSALMSGYGRKQELEADRLGARYLRNSGYSPWAMRDVIGILKTQEEFEIRLAKKEGRRPNVYHGVFASHPDNDQRLLKVIAAAGGNSARGTTLPAEPDFLNRLEGLQFGPAPSQGVIRNGRFLHRELDLHIAFPDQWRIDNQPERLLAVSPGRDAFIQVALDKAQPGQNLQQYLAQQFPGLWNASSFQINGINGYAGFAALDTPFGPRDAQVTVNHHNHWLLVCIGVWNEGRPGAAFTQTINSMRSLDAEEQVQASGYRISLVSTQPGDSYQTLAAKSSLQADDIDRLRLLNGDFPNGELVPGRLIKTITRQ